MVIALRGKRQVIVDRDADAAALGRVPHVISTTFAGSYKSSSATYNGGIVNTNVGGSTIRHRPSTLPVDASKSVINGYQNGDQM